MSVRPATDDPRKNRAHDGSVRTDTDQLADRLQELFGANLVAHMAGISDVKRVHRWSKGGGMNAQSERRLRAAYQVAWRLLEHDSAETVRAWFIGMNPQLEYEAPADAIRDDRAREVMVAAEAFIEGA